MILVYCIDSINGIGGIQHATLMKARALAEINQNSVWIVFADDSGKLCFHLSANVKTINLGINYYKDDWKSPWRVLKGILIKRRKHRFALKKVLTEIQPDVVISVGQSEKNLVPSIRGKWVTVREFHFVRNYRTLHARSFFDRILAWGGDCLDRVVLKRYDRIVTLTQEDKEKNWRGWNNVYVIPNPVQPSAVKSSLTSKRLLAIGRLVYQKNFSSLIRAFSIVVKRFPEWSLDIVGEGEERRALSSLIKSLNLYDFVHLVGEQSDIIHKLPNYSLFVQSSRFEGFSLVLIEAMLGGLPVISYACPCGPKDIIRDGIDGFLIPQGDEASLAERICQLIEDETLRRKMGAAAQERAKEFSLEKVIPMWTSLFEELVKEKKK